MIRSEAEYREAVKRVQEARVRLGEEKEKLLDAKKSRDEIERLLDARETFLLQIQEEVASYERLKRGEFDEIHNLQGIGELLIGLRIYRGISQKDLAEKLGVHESQVSRDERNEYHNITLDRANKIIEVLGVQLETRVNITEPARIE